MEALLISLGGCTGMDVISILRKKKQRVTRFHINLRGTQAEDFPHRFTRIELEYVVRGWDISDQAVARAIELSQTKYCSVKATLNCEVAYTYRIEQEPVES
jgi:putative redox protein